MSYCYKGKRIKSIPIGLTLALLLSLFPFYPVSPGFSAGVAQIWDPPPRYNGTANDDDSAVDIAVDAAGNVYVTGRSRGQMAGTPSGDDYVTIKYGPNGNQAWGAGENGVRRYGFKGDDEAKAMALDSSGNVYVTGKSFNVLRGNSDYVTIKYDTDGNLKWESRYDGPDTQGNDAVGDEPAAMAVDSGGNVYVTGKSDGGMGAGADYATIKLNGTNGAQLWEKRYNGPIGGADAATAMAIDSGFVYVTGESQRSATDPTDYDYLTIKYNASNGDPAWGLGETGVKVYSGPGSFGNKWDRARALTVDSGGNIYVTGESIGNLGNLDYATIKYNSAGNQVWGARETGVKRYNGRGNDADVPHSLAVDSAGNVYVTGESWGLGTGLDYATVKYDPFGNRVWPTDANPEIGRYDGPIHFMDIASDLALDSSGNIYVTGRSPGNQSQNDYTTLKYDPTTGTVLWVERYNGPANGADHASAIAVDSQGGIYVTGESDGRPITGTNTPNYDYATIKYVPDFTAPTNPQISSPSHTPGPSTWSNDNTIGVSWPPVGQPGGAIDFPIPNNVAGYSFDWNKDPISEPDQTIDLKIPETSTTSPPLASGFGWYFRLRTVDNAGNWSDPTPVLGPFFIDITPPTPDIIPPSLITIPISTTEIDLSWTAFTDADSGLAGYEIERSTDGVHFTPRATTPATSYPDTGLSPATTYWYRVRAVDNAGNPSRYITAQTATPLTVTNAVFTWGNPGPGDLPLVGDFNGDGLDEAGIFRPATAHWFFKLPLTGNTTSSLSWGNPGDTPLVGDFDGDGKKDDLGIFRSSTAQWFFNYNPLSDPATDHRLTWGNPGDTPLVGNFNGATGDEIGLRRPSTAQWFLNNNLDSVADFSFNWGNPGGEDIPLIGNFNASGGEDIGVYRSGRWFFKWSFKNNFTDDSIGWGDPGDTPLIGDFDGDSFNDDLGIFRSHSANWYFNFHQGALYNSQTNYSFLWGNPGDTPLVGNFGGDAKTDLAIRRSSTAVWLFNWGSLP